MRRSCWGRWNGEEHWKLSAQEFTVSSRDVCASQQPKRNRCGQDMCAVQLSHVLKQANNGSTMTPGDVRLFAADQRTNLRPDQFVTGCNRRLWSFLFFFLNGINGHTLILSNSSSLRSILQRVLWHNDLS